MLRQLHASLTGLLASGRSSSAPPSGDQALELVCARRALIMVQMCQEDTQARLRKSELALVDAHADIKQRDQFIAMLGHDLRNSLQSITFGAEQLRNSGTDARSVIERIERSCGRMSDLVQNLFDLTQAGLGRGVSLQTIAHGLLADGLQHVITEISSVHSSRRIDASIHIEAPVDCDRPRIAQVLSNLLTNAVSYGSADQPVTVVIQGNADQFEIAVSNAGPPIAPELIGHLFEAFTRGHDPGRHDGLGLGLYIVSQIAKSHGAQLHVASDSQLTCFTFRMANSRAGAARHVLPKE